MRLILLSTLLPRRRSPPRLADGGLLALGQEVTSPTVPLDAPDAAALGYAVADTWTGSPPDVVLAVGWEAGVAAQVAARELPAPVVLRLPVPAGRQPGRHRVERALARSGAPVLAARHPSRGRDPGADGRRTRARVRVLPEAVDAPRVTRPGAATARPTSWSPSDDGPADVAAVLEGTAAGRPAVVLDRGVLADLVGRRGDRVVVPGPGDLRAAARSLQADPMRRRAWGWPRPTGSRRGSTRSVVVPVLGRLVDEVQRQGAIVRLTTRPPAPVGGPRGQGGRPGRRRREGGPAPGRTRPRRTPMRRLLGRAVLAGAVALLALGPAGVSAADEPSDERRPRPGRRW